MRFPGTLTSHAVAFMPWMAWVLALAMPAAAAADTDVVQFNRDIRPILSDQCFSCHGFDAKKRKAGLRLDVAEGAFAPGKEGRVAIKPGDPAASELWRRIESGDPDAVMPPPETHKSVSAAQKAVLKRWIEQGARYQRHWSLETPARPPVPAGATAHPVDRFIRDRLAQEGLQPAPEADARTLARRVTLDLTGLPPTPSEVARFLSDTAPGAYERLVDRLLASPRYGERMARLWLDVARYADTPRYWNKTRIPWS